MRRKKKGVIDSTVSSPPLQSPVPDSKNTPFTSKACFTRITDVYKTNSSCSCLFQTLDTLACTKPGARRTFTSLIPSRVQTLPLGVPKGKVEDMDCASKTEGQNGKRKEKTKRDSLTWIWKAQRSKYRFRTCLLRLWGVWGVRRGLSRAIYKHPETKPAELCCQLTPSDNNGELAISIRRLLVVLHRSAPSSTTFHPSVNLPTVQLTALTP